MTIRGRIALVSAGAVAVAVILISLVTYSGARNAVMGQIDEALLDRAAEVAELRSAQFLAVLGISREVVPRNRLVPPRRGDFDSAYYQVILSDGRVFHVGPDDLVLPEPPAAYVNSEESTLRSVSVDGVHFRIVTTVHREGRAVVQIARPLTEADAALARLSILLVVGSLVGIAVAGGVGLVVARQAVKPIDDLTLSIGLIADNRAFFDRVEVVGHDEVAKLATEFNLLLDELESGKQQQVRLVRDAGHELRTPLTALRTNLEVLQRHKVDDETRIALLAAANAEVEELASLITEVVDLATDRYEEETVTPVDLADVVSAVAERLETRRDREIVLVIEPSVVMGRPNALERAVSNIVGNADKFSPPDSPITIEVKDGTVTVTDTGTGIADEDLPFIWERFYRANTARSEPGSGLGLSIVTQIIDDHNGTVFARSSVSSGTSVGFTLPTVP
ncbi:MAG: HAMP domain-containing histidine kinase [Acidobacteria bacterium]|nr:MAG: HAMP domain-containing histidine kinase [Acidobacteriota bacterium]